MSLVGLEYGLFFLWIGILPYYTLLELLDPLFPRLEPLIVTVFSLSPVVSKLFMGEYLLKNEKFQGDFSINSAFKARSDASAMVHTVCKLIVSYNL